MNLDELTIELESIGDKLSHYEYDEVESRLHHALKFALLLGDKHSIGHTYFLQGYYYQNFNDYDQCIKLYLRSIEIFKELGEQRRILTSYMNIGTCLDRIGNTLEALRCYKEALKIIDEQKKFYSRKASLLNNISLIYLNQEDFTTGVLYLQDSYDLMVKENAIHDIPRVAYNLATVYYLLGDIDSSKQYNEVLHNYASEFKSELFLIKHEIMLAFYDFYETRDTEQFMIAHHNIMDKLKPFSPFDTLLNNQLFARVLFELKLYSHAKPILESVLKTSTSMDIKTFQSMARARLQTIYALEGDYEKAYSLAHLEVNNYKHQQLQALEYNSIDFALEYKSLKKKEYVDTLEDQLDIFKLLSKIGEGISDNLSPRAIYEFIVKQIDEIWNIDVFTLSIVNAKRDYVDCYINTPENRFDIQTQSLDQNNSLINYCINENKEIILIDRIHDEEYINRFPKPIVTLIKHSNYNSFFILPIVSKNQVVGGISIESRSSDYFNGRDLEVLRTLASYCAAAISNYRRHLHLHNMKEIDGLTSISNRHALISYNNKLDQNKAFVKTPLFMAMLDIDYFKEYNDNYGHLAGDKCLVKVVDIINKEVANIGGRLFRFGGDEFVLLVENFKYSSAITLVESIKNSLYKENLIHNHSQVSDRITLSIGGIIVRDFNQTTSDYYAKADANLYKVKEHGRNGHFIDE